MALKTKDPFFYYWYNDFGAAHVHHTATKKKEGFYGKAIKYFMYKALLSMGIWTTEILLKLMTF